MALALLGSGSLPGLSKGTDFQNDQEREVGGLPPLTRLPRQRAARAETALTCSPRITLSVYTSFQFIPGTHCLEELSEVADSTQTQ